MNKRNFTGNFFYTTGAWSSDISIYQRDPKAGLLKLIKKQKCGQSPMWISLVSKPKENNNIFK